ncbi:MAG: hypothetical protein DMD34_14700 [Gemmatimonadetes bacterium]|nr:MAG: hypothetical protein DMD46_14425 [Gemmatimonadota bacterium]PYP92235.1 MAG: hypothetical protein DMD34_14700 [Gemmatimonadota bacterium]
MVEREEIQLAFGYEHWLKASARMLLRAGLRRIGQLVSKPTQRMDDGTRHVDFGTSGMVLGHVRLGLDGTGYGHGDSREEDGRPKHEGFLRVLVGPSNGSRLSCRRKTRRRKASEPRGRLG